MTSIVPDKKVAAMRNAGFLLVGNHSAVKACHYTKKAMDTPIVCYKSKWYGITPHRCIQMSPALLCNLRCRFCWRDLDVFNKVVWHGPTDEPADIIDGCIKAQVRYLMGFGGNPLTTELKMHEMMQPKHFAISLTGEPTLYPKLPELVTELEERKITSFLVTNGTLPVNLQKLVSVPLTQLYITVAAPDKETYQKTVNPLMASSWANLMKSLDLLSDFSCRRVVRLTLVKGLNMIKPEGYAELLRYIDFDYIEAKAYMHIGYSMERLGTENMPLQQEIMDFAEELASHLDAEVIDFDDRSRVALIKRK